MDMARSMMAHIGLPDNYLAEAVDAAVNITNHTSNASIKGYKTPYQVCSGEKLNVGYLKVFGCTAYAHIHVPDTLRKKLDKRALKLRFVAYSTQSKGY